jgi:DNA polymerase-3 subunit alpha
LRLGHKEKAKNNKIGTMNYYRKAIDYTRKMRDIFGDDFYIELQIPGESIEGAREVFYQMSDISKKLQIPAVMTGDLHYLHRRDFELQKTMMAIEQNTLVTDPNLFHVDSDEGFFKNRAQFRQIYVEQGYDKYDNINWFEKICDNTMAISEKCSAFEPDLAPKLPEIQGADEMIQKLVAQALITKGLHKCVDRYQIDSRMVTYKEQARIELNRIIEKKFSSYFLITRNLVHHARDNKWDVGPARGSAGGSLVCYLLGIHDMDPLKWGLSFDRFLSPSRGGFMLEVEM